MAKKSILMPNTPKQVILTDIKIEIGKLEINKEEQSRLKQIVDLIAKNNKIMNSPEFWSKIALVLKLIGLIKEKIR